MPSQALLKEKFLTNLVNLSLVLISWKKGLPKNRKHRNKPNRMSDAEIMVILILFHIGGFRCFKHYYMEYVCKHLRGLFPRCVSYNRFVELEKGVLLPLTIFIKNVLLGTCTGISFVDSPPPCVFVVINAYRFTSPLRGLRSVGNALWAGFSDSSCT